MSKETRRKFSKEFKLEAVKLVQEHGYSWKEVAERLEVSEGGRRRWSEEQEAKGEAQASPVNGK